MRRAFNPKAKEIFNEVLKGKNIMTPHIIAYGVRGNLAYELSEGIGMKDHSIFGVTVIQLNGVRRTDLSDCFDSIEEADEYIKNNFKSQVE